MTGSARIGLDAQAYAACYPALPQANIHCTPAWFLQVSRSVLAIMSVSCGMALIVRTHHGSGFHFPFSGRFYVAMACCSAGSVSQAVSTLLYSAVKQVLGNDRSQHIGFQFLILARPCQAGLHSSQYLKDSVAHQPSRSAIVKPMTTSNKRS